MKNKTPMVNCLTPCTLISPHCTLNAKSGSGGQQLTICGGARLALKAERRSETCAVVEAPAFLHFGRTGTLRADVRHRRPSVVYRRRLPVL